MDYTYSDDTPSDLQTTAVPLRRASAKPWTRPPLSPFEFGDEEDFTAFADRLEIGGLVDRAVDRDGGFFFEVFAETGVEAVHLLDDAAQVLRLDGEFAHPAGVAAAEARGED